MLSRFKSKTQNLKKFIKFLIRLTRALLKARSKGHFGSALQLLKQRIKVFLLDLNNHVQIIAEIGDLKPRHLQTYRKRVLGLHSLFPHPEQFKYSILIPVYQPNPYFFEVAVQSALDQTAPFLEVILGLDGPQKPEIWAVIQKLQASCMSGSRGDRPSPLKVVELDRSQGKGISYTTNQIAKEATGNFLLFMDHDDWIAPDLLYRYEQCLRLLKEPENTVLYCNEYKINENDEPLPGTFIRKPEHPVFPYLFVNDLCHCLMVPKKLWEKTGGLRSECDGAQDFDLCLRLDRVGAIFQLVPFFLYAWRAHALSTALITEAKDYATPAGIRALQDYTKAKGLDWEITAGIHKTTYRAIPRTPHQTKIHVIMPFKNQREYTLRAVQSILNQKNVTAVITAVDNGSSDTEIGEQLLNLGVEVLRRAEPFNYSRLNNHAVKDSRYGPEYPVLLFLNNDVDLEPNALEEMLLWVDQPRIGMVGARLHYPEGSIQHGGAMLTLDGNPVLMNWIHRDCKVPIAQSGVARIPGICDAVTAACMMMKRETFLSVGGFDEIWYPIAFSDTDLALRLRRLGLYAFYTPYAVGIHHESITRGPGIFETAEASYWMFRSTANRQHPQERLNHHLFLDGS